MLSDMKKTLILSVILGLTSIAAAQTDTTTTTTTTTTTQTGTDDAAMNADDFYQRAQEEAAQAETAYPVAFVDRTLWKAAVNDAAMAASMNPENRNYTSYAAQLYTKTQWWINAYNTWMKLGELTDQERDWAALSAAKLAYLALERGDKTTARTYITQGMTWRNTPALQSLMRRL